MEETIRRLYVDEEKLTDAGLDNAVTMKWISADQSAEFKAAKAAKAGS